MIQCNVTVGGVISKGATPKRDKGGAPAFAFTVRTNIPGNPREISVDVYVTSTDMTFDQSQLTIGRQVIITGTLTPRNNNGMTVLYLAAASINANPTVPLVTIEGTMEFRGTLGNQIERKTSRKGTPFLVFSAYSATKGLQGFEYVWVRFVRFSDQCEEFMQPKNKIIVNGKLELSAYNGKMSIGCLVDQVSVPEPKPFYKIPENQELPF